MDAEHDKVLEEQKAAFKAANDAQARAHAAAEAVRKRKEEEQLASHKRQFAARKANFEDKHSNTWSEATTGISIMQIDVEDRIRADELIHGLFYEFLVADVEELNLQVLVQTWIKDGKERIWTNQNLITMITSDEKVPQVLAYIENFKPPEPDAVPFNFVVVPIATGGKAYIEWVLKKASHKRVEERETLGANGLPTLSTIQSPGDED